MEKNHFLILSHQFLYDKMTSSIQQISDSNGSHSHNPNPKVEYWHILSISRTPNVTVVHTMGLRETAVIRDLLN